MLGASELVIYEARLRYGQKYGKEVLVVLLDNCLVIFREKKDDAGQPRLKVFKPAMPLESLSFTEGAVGLGTSPFRGQKGQKKGKLAPKMGC